MPAPQLNEFPAARLRLAAMALILSALVFALLTFLSRQIRNTPGPILADFEKKYLDEAAVRDAADSEKQLRELAFAAEDDHARRLSLRESADREARTVETLLALQRDKSPLFGEAEQKRLAESLEKFLYNQKRDEELGELTSGIAEQRAMLGEKKRAAEALLAPQRAAVQKKFERARADHQSQIDAFLISFDLAIFGALALAFSKIHEPLANPVFCANAAAVLARIALDTRHVHGWPQLALPVLLLVVFWKQLSHLAEELRYPKGDALFKKRSEAYAAARCPLCDAPFRAGEKNGATENCASCGARLFEECAKCHAPRHVLLPFCEHCGVDKRRAGTPV